MTTVKNFRALADSWVAYHLAVGFVHLYVYFDDPAELKAIDLMARFPEARLTCVPHDAALRAAWATLPQMDDRILRLATTEVQTRQQLNARHALGRAVALRLDWLVHIDADELFYPGPACDAAAHFGALSKAGVATFCYLNHEAVPERHGIEDPFREVSLFKRSLEVVPRTERAQAALGIWQARQEGSFFYYYDNGKAAVRVAPEARPLSVHEWLPGKSEDMASWYSNMRDNWPGRGELGKIVKYRDSDACILHYPCYNSDALWIRWKRGNDNCASFFACTAHAPAMAAVSDRPLLSLIYRCACARALTDRLGGRENPPPLHAQVCRAADAAHARGGEASAREVVRRLFEERVMLTDAREAEEQQRAGVCERFRAPARILAKSSTSNPRGAARDAPS